MRLLRGLAVAVGVVLLCMAAASTPAQAGVGAFELAGFGLVLGGLFVGRARSE